MVMLFQPLLTNALIYVDDILMFSKDAESHEKLLTEYYNIVKSQGIMLSEKKMIIGKSSIDFLGVSISDEGNVNAIITVKERVSDVSSPSFPWKAMLLALVQESHLDLKGMGNLGFDWGIFFCDNEDSHALFDCKVL
ncbi:hypothetical protein SO802_004968 [Lithocarpus litseifolius]|uniref:Reverse transcriptase domain-containing protein n=1 Tax=Lithocarpus litseifolius TaxID=425828 RepID=A0AAW2DKK2_9ROSI